MKSIEEQFKGKGRWRGEGVAIGDHLWRELESLFIALNKFCFPMKMRGRTIKTEVKEEPSDPAETDETPAFSSRLRARKVRC